MKQYKKTKINEMSFGTRFLISSFLNLKNNIKRKMSYKDYFMALIIISDIIQYELNKENKRRQKK